MPRRSEHVLSTDPQLKKLKRSGVTPRTEFRVEGIPGLWLRVTPNGTCTWSCRYVSPATRKPIKTALGKYPALSLVEAKKKALELAGDVANSRCPVHDKRQSQLAETFADLAVRYMREHEPRNARAGRRSRSTDEAQRQLDHDILPLLGRLMAEAVTRQHVMRVVETIADRGAYVAADRALGLIRAIYNWACGTGRLDRNPTLGLKKRNAGRIKVRVLSAAELRAFWCAIDGPGMTPALRDAMRLQLATGVRIGEALCASRDEFDLERAVWTLPAARTKAEREHTLPLSPLAVWIVRDAIENADAKARSCAEREGVPFSSSPWLFPSPGPRTRRAVSTERDMGKPIDAHAATRAIVRNRSRLASAGIVQPFNTHDLRRTVATQLGEMGVADELIERILNHAPRTVTGRHYNHARYLEPMRKALDAWGERLTEIVEGREPASNVVALRNAGGRHDEH